MEFAIGKIGIALGPEFAEADSFPTRVRLPDEPLMLADRILEIEGEARSMTQGRVVTEHDIHPDSWYLDCNRIPTCIAVEAGQADLFLSGYLGIDFETRGEAVYRLLDAQVTFRDELPEPGNVIHYEIHIDRFFQHGQTWFFHFRFEGTVNSKPLLSMENGCAGFFTEAELAAGIGIVHTEFQMQAMPGKTPEGWRPLVPMQIESYSDEKVTALRNGDLAGCFGPQFDGIPIQHPVTLPGGRMRLVDRVSKLDPQGGRFGIGQITAELDIHPDDWFLTCHFVDDMVMPGTLMYECCMHTLRIFLLRMGWIGEEGDLAYQPIPGVASTLKCRGQVIESTKQATYQVTLKEIGYRPEPFVIVDALMFSDEKPIVEITNMTCQLAGMDREKVERVWNRESGIRNQESGVAASSFEHPESGIEYDRQPAIYSHEQILAFAVGKPSEAFGERYEAFDEERVIARLPGPPYQFLDRITEVEGEPWVLESGPVAVAQYDIPPDGWYFASNAHQDMPFAVLLEIALQPCGWLAAYCGSALTSDNDLSFRNLGGSATQFEAIHPNMGTLTTRVKMTNVSQSGGMIIQNFDMEMTCEDRTVYKGDTYFGFFSKEALANQVGIRDAVLYAPAAAEADRAETFEFPGSHPYPDEMLRMIDRVDLFVPDGGPAGLGYIQGSLEVRPESWFFKAHFFQDPVIPGSLGLESFLQLLKVLALRRWGWEEGRRIETIAVGERHEWVYRGQVIPPDEKVIVQAIVSEVDDAQRLMKADGFLTVDGRVIYQMKDFTLRIR